MSDAPGPAARSDQLADGEAEVRGTLRVLRQLAGPAFQHDHILDFGCGDCRWTIPLGRIAQRVVGVDIDSTAMATAADNCRQSGLTNIECILSSAGLANVAGPFDIVLSRSAFERLDPVTGYQYLADVL